MANKYTMIKVDVERIVELYNSGMTQSEVAEELGITQKLVWHRLKTAGIKCRIAAKRNQLREANDSWKGLDAGYQAFHRRLDAANGKPKKCEICGTEDPSRHYDWANLTGNYDDPSDYKRMCRSCHWKYDGTIRNIKGGQTLCQ